MEKVLKKDSKQSKKMQKENKSLQNYEKRALFYVPTFIETEAIIVYKNTKCEYDIN